MWFSRRPRFLLVAACLGMASCDTTSTRGNVRLLDNPLASAHSDISFTVNTTFERGFSCVENGNCPEAWINGDAHFPARVKRIADTLQSGAHRLYPDLEQRIPGLVNGRFNVYVVANDQPGSASSANGRIVLNSALAALQPDDPWLAFVIAREMGHVIARHHEENSMLSMIASVILNIAIPGSGLLKNALSTGGSYLAGKSRQEIQMLESDRIALNLLDASGFRRRDVVQSLQVAPVLRDGNAWTSRFTRSSAHLVAEVRHAGIRVGGLDTAGAENRPTL